MLIQTLESRHVDAVARLHCAALTGLLSSLGLRATRAFYAGAVRSPLMMGFVCTEGDTVLGHVFGSIEPGKLRAESIRANRLDVLVWVGLGIARRPSLLADLLRNRTVSHYDPRQPELTYLAVAPGRRGAGIGRQLVTAFDEAVRRSGANAYELSVDDDNHPAIIFYERLGFRLIGRYREFGKLHRRYRLDLDPA